MSLMRESQRNGIRSLSTNLAALAKIFGLCGSNSNTLDELLVPAELLVLKRVQLVTTTDSRTITIP